MEQDEITARDEAIILQQGLQGEFWAILVKNFTNWRGLAMRELLSPNFAHKDYLAGKVKVLEDVMNFPTTRIKRLETKK